VGCLDLGRLSAEITLISDLARLLQAHGLVLHLILSDTRQRISDMR
jgi:hypothetical protein